MPPYIKAQVHERLGSGSWPTADVRCPLTSLRFGVTAHVECRVASCHRAVTCCLVDEYIEVGSNSVLRWWWNNNFDALGQTCKHHSHPCLSNVGCCGCATVL